MYMAQKILFFLKTKECFLAANKLVSIFFLQHRPRMNLSALRIETVCSSAPVKIYNLIRVETSISLSKFVVVVPNII